MNKNFRILAVALGLTTLCTAWLIEPLVEPKHVAIYHWAESPSVLFGPALVEFVVTWLLIALLLLLARREGRRRAAVWMGILIFVPWTVLRNVRLLWPNTALTRIHLNSWFLIVPVLWLALVLLWRPANAARYERVIGWASKSLMFVALSGALFLSEFLLFWWQARSLNDPRPLHHEISQVQPRPRILWIVMDELSFLQTYAHRYPGLQLPAFDSMAAQSADFTHVAPAGAWTQVVLPSLFEGKLATAMESSPGGQLLLKDARSGKWQRFDQHDTVFQDALDNDYRTSVAGWFNPYCRIAPAVLDDCYWTYDFVLQNGMSLSGSFRSNLRNSSAVLIEMFIGGGAFNQMLSRWLPIPHMHDRERALHITEFRELYKRADEVLYDRAADFALLHLPIPHPPGIYDRATGHLSTGESTYIDNLALADKYLAHIQQVLKETGQWDSSTVIVMGDHGWRTKMIWEGSSDWTAEEQRASRGGKFDRRPVYLVKLPNEHSGVRIDAPFQAVRTRSLLDALMAGTIRSDDDLQQWVRNPPQKKTGPQTTQAMLQ